jgi:outer membrane protein TolC
MKSKVFIFLLPIVGSFFIGLTSRAQDTATLTLNQAIAATLNNNKTARIAKLNEDIARANYRQTDAVFLPQVSFSYTAMTTNDPLNAFGYKLEQRSITQNDFSPALLNHPSGTPDVMTKLEVQQPLINADMLYARKGAEKQVQVYRYQSQRTTEYLTFEVQKAWLQLQLAYKAVDVLDEARKTAGSVYKFTNDHYQQGLIQKSDVLNAQVHLTGVESNLSKAKSNINNASDYLSELMGAKIGIIYTIDEQPLSDLPVSDTTVKVADNRADFMAMQKAIEGSDMMLKSNQMSFLPKLNAFGNYQYNDSHLTGFGANSYLVGVQLSWDIFKGNARKSKIDAQRLERDKLTEQLRQQKQQGQMELSKAIRGLDDTRSEISRDRVAVDQAAESMRILQNRYQQGLINTTDVLIAETQLSQQKFALAQAEFNLAVTKAYIQFLTSSASTSKNY